MSEKPAAGHIAKPCNQLPDNLRFVHTNCGLPLRTVDLPQRVPSFPECINIYLRVLPQCIDHNVQLSLGFARFGKNLSQKGLVVDVIDAIDNLVGSPRLRCWPFGFARMRPLGITKLYVNLLISAES
ncbi:hypothetical protein [Ollibium composti]|uniref:Uncharacterized protein n=1 Tax=Ollibium composti TaxID=2675109 RepID=A0ABY2Q0S8_9HYPH|nr:hypothetical protein [Mesorhizobium composti]THF54325.1 hypothetical protein E6C48_22370 [Mesorhizobium composti]